MAASDLNVKVALDIREFNKGLREMQRTLQQTAESVGSIGNKLTLGLTAPLLAMGAAAIKSAGDLESLALGLQTVMTDAGYSVDQARMEMEKLREVGKNPGIDFEQAVKASLRLQGVGFSAAKARDTITQLANAIAAAGGDPQSLDRVTVQMAQMIGKGEVLASDLQVMKESLPSLATLMQKAFGKTTAEGIREAGINSEQFVAGITEQMRLMGRVPGGINNAIVNAGNSIKQFLAEIGQDLNDLFNISGNLDAFGNWLGGLSEGWRNLSRETKETIVQVIAFAAALGPAFKLVQFGIGVIQSVTAAMGALKTAQMAASVSGGGFIATWKAMDAAVKTTVIGAAVAVVLALGVAFATAATKATALQEVQQEANDAIRAEKLETERLVKTLESETSTRDEKLKALNKLQQISPEYFGQLRIENGIVLGLRDSYDLYIQSILKSARAKSAKDKLVALDAEKEKLEESLKTYEKIQQQEQKNGVQSKLTAGILAQQQRLINENLAQQAQLTEKIKEAEKPDPSTLQVEKRIEAEKKAREKAAAAADAQKKSLDGLTKQTKVYEEALSDVQNVMKQAALTGQSENVFEDQVDAIDKAISKLLDAGYSPDNPKVKQFLDMMKALRGENVEAAPTIATPELPTGSIGGDIVGRDALDTITKATDGIKVVGQQAVDTTIKIDGLSTSFASMLANMGMSVEGMQNIGNGMKIMAESSADAFQGLWESALGVEGAYTRMGAAALVAASKMVKAALAATIAKAIQESMTKSGHPLLGVALAGVAVAGVTALFSRLEQSVSKSPKFAKGAMVFGPTSAIVGDNPGASVDPEVIAPLSKLKQYMQPQQQMLGGEFTISGYNLKLLLDKVNRAQMRTF